jgi:SAM-dependent methyltransferase
MAEYCRSCKVELKLTFCDLGKTPLANSYAKKGDVEYFFPLRAFLCSKCYLVQLGEFQTPDQIFSHYAYFSSYSDSWVAHARTYVENVSKRFLLGKKSKVIEVASNDGYLLQHFLALDIPVLGIEPAKNIAEVSLKKGIPTLCAFFGLKTAQSLEEKADLLVGNNVLAHVPDLNDFVAGLKVALKPTGVLTMEFPHLLQLIEKNQFDTIYHEHFSYFSLYAVEAVFARHELELFDVEELSTHGGSLRVYLQHKGGPHEKTERILLLREKEKAAGIGEEALYSSFQQKCENIRSQLVKFLDHAKSQGKIVAGYGAPAKGNTLLNYCGVTPELLAFTVDRSPYKQGYFLPGTKIPIYNPEKIKEVKPDYLLILPWNLSQEIIQQMSFIRDWNGKFVVPIPELQVL